MEHSKKEILIDAALAESIEQYCELNGIDHYTFVNDCLKKGLMVYKYGEKPPFVIKKKEVYIEEKKPKAEQVEEKNETVETQQMKDEPVVPIKKETEIIKPKTRKRVLS